MKTFEAGRIAESIAASYLEEDGFKIIGKNWRTRNCEIDIIAEKAKCIYFVEVKYRQNSDWGGGFDYITPTKVKQMTFAAELWVSTHNWQGDYGLGGIEVSGKNFEITNVIFDL